MLSAFVLIYPGDAILKPKLPLYQTFLFCWMMSLTQLWARVGVTLGILKVTLFFFPRHGFLWVTLAVAVLDLAL